ncbi:MAG: 3',5'-cyclic-nucleotide phosphodiesterase, partial [Gluconobacter sp.]
MRIALVLKGLLAALPLLLYASIAQASDFDIVVLGAAGGRDAGTLSAYLIRPEGADKGVLCDAGTVLHGLK